METINSHFQQLAEIIDSAISLAPTMDSREALQQLSSEIWEQVA